MREQPLIIECAPVPRPGTSPSARLMDKRRVTVADSDVAQLGERLQPDRAADRDGEGMSLSEERAWRPHQIGGEGYTARPFRPRGYAGVSRRGYYGLSKRKAARLGRPPGAPVYKSLRKLLDS